MGTYTTVRIDRKLVGRVKAYAHQHGITITEAATQLTRAGLNAPNLEPEEASEDLIPPVLRPAAVPQRLAAPAPSRPAVIAGEQLATALELLIDELRAMREEAAQPKRPASGMVRKVGT